VAASFADLDGDGDLDLYVSNYAVFDIEEQRGTVRWFPVEQFPHYFPPEENILYRNDGDGSFTDVTAESGSAGNARSMTVLATDYDDDGDIDLFVANDIGFNDLYRNDGGLRFRNVAVEAGVACDAEGRFQASMGAASGDYDNDGDIDLFVTNYGAEYHTLYRNVGNGFFTDVTVAAGLATREAIDTVGWGVGLYDFDLDGNLDLLLVSGHVLDGIALFGMRNTWLAGGIDEELKAYPQMTGPAFALGSDQPKLLFLGRGDGTFLEASEQAGRTFRLPRMGRGAAFADFDDDGRIDVAVSNKNQPLQVLLNRIPPAGSWLKLELRARPPNVHAVGARVWVHTPAVTLTREILAGSSYCSSDMYTAHFGLGVDPGPVEVEVRWPDGKVERFSGLLPERHYLVRQGVPETRQIAPAPAASVAGAAHAPAAESGAYTESQRAR
jgi:predicted nucleotidyltransferase